MKAWVNPAGLYLPGTTVVHRAPVWLTLGLLSALGVTLAVLRGPPSALAGLVAVLGIAGLARLPLRPTARGLVPILVTCALLLGYHAWRGSLALGVEVAADLLAMVLAATVITSTTPMDVLLDVLTRLVRPLRHVGLDPESFALAVALMLRTIPALGALFQEVRDASRARGLERSPRAILVPFVVRAVSRAQNTGDALAARGIGD